MPTIEVDESDQVFVVKGRGSARGGYHELGPNDLVVTMRQTTFSEDPRDLAEIQPYGQIYVGGSPVSGFERFSFVRGQRPTDCVVEFTFPESERNRMSVLRRVIQRLEPFVNIRQEGNYDDIIDPNDRIVFPPPVGVPSVERQPVARVSRYDREPVI